MRNTLLAMTLLTLVACGGGEYSDRHLARAKDYIAESDYPAATIELQNAVRLDPKSEEARWLLGNVYLATGEIQLAEKELLRAQELDWTADDVRPALATVLMAQGRFQDVIALDHQGLAPPAAALLLSHQTLAALANNRVDTARELLALALGKAPQLLEAKLAQATLAVYQSDPAQALDLVEAILESTPESGQAWLLKGQALGKQGALEEARAAFDQAVAHSNVAYAARVSRALINLQLRDYEAAQADTAELLRASPKNLAAKYVQGLIHFQNKEYREAITDLTQAEPVAEQFPMLLYYLSLCHLVDKDPELAEKFAQDFVKLAPGDSRGRKLFAAILVRQDKAERVPAVLQPVLDYNPADVAALNIMANALLLDGQPDIGLSLYARITQLQPDWPIAPLNLEGVRLASDTGGDESELPSAGPDSTANFPQTDILLILHHLAKKDFPSAIEAAKSYQFRDLESVAPYRVLGIVYLAAGQPEDAKYIYEKALERAPEDVFTNLSLAQMALQSGAPGAARSVYQTVLSDHPDDLVTLLQLAALEAREKNTPAMAAALQQATVAHPNALEPRLRLASYYMASGTAAKVEPLFVKLTELQQRSPRVLLLVGMAQLAQKQNAAALATLQQLVDANPQPAQYRVLLARAASENGDQRKARQELLAAIKSDPQHVPALINLAGMARLQGASEEFEQYLATLVEVAPDDPEVLRLRAISANSRGEKAQALELAQRAFKQAPTTQTVLVFAGLQTEAGKKGAARNTLQNWIAKHPADIAVRLFLAHDLEREENTAAAQVQYLAVLELDPQNISALNNMAWNLRLDNRQQAVEYIRKATLVAPDHPDLLDTLAVIEHLGGDNASAQRSIQRALERAPGNRTMLFHKAMIEAALGNNEQAIATLEALLDQESDSFAERAEAQKLLTALRG